MQKPEAEAATATATAVSKDDTANLIGTSMAGAKYLALLRLITFVLGQFQNRAVNPETLGLVAVEFELLLSTILFLSREAFRTVLLRVQLSTQGSRTKKQRDVNAAVTNMAYLPVLAGSFISLAVCVYRLWSTSALDESSGSGLVSIAVIAYAVSACVELLIEPMYIHLQLRMRVGLMAAAEGAAAVIQCIVQLGLTLYIQSLLSDTDGTKSTLGGYSSAGLFTLAYAAGRLMYTFVLGLVYSHHFLVNKPSAATDDGCESMMELLVPRKIVSEDGGSFYYIDREMLSLAYVFMRQSLLKHVLTMGDKIVLIKTGSDSQKGVYAMVENYGGLVVRLIFFPVEESSRMLFRRLLGQLKASDSPQVESKNVDEEKSKVSLGLKCLTALIRLNVIIGAIFITFGPNFSTTFINLLGDKWSRTNAAFVLSLFCLYIPAMGINGVTEAFVQSVASGDEINTQSFVMVSCTVAYLGCGYLLSTTMNSDEVLGPAASMVLANIINMAMRISWSLGFAERYFRSFGVAKTNERAISLNNVLPSKYALLTLAISFVATRLSLIYVYEANRLMAALGHIGCGAVFFAATAGVLFLTERKFIADLRKQIYSSKSD
ncbi:Rft-1-domain-containing protein [Ramicandelaber brevisporus]|nr:Rft-1-domain-containing protein [Ramicandelaber brevisporus]